MRPMNPQGDPRSYHSWSVWGPIDYLGFCRKCFVMKVERRFHRCTDIKCPLCLSKSLMNPFQLHPNPYSGPILLIVMAFLGLAAQMNHYFCKQLAFFLILRDFIWKLTLRVHFDHFFIGCMVSADYWLTTQPSTIGGPLGEPGFCIFCSTAYQGSTLMLVHELLTLLPGTVDGKYVWYGILKKVLKN